MTAQSLQAQDIARLEADEQMPFKSQSLMQTALRRLRKDYLTLLALGTLILLTLLAVFAPQIEDLYDVSYTRPNPQAQLMPPGMDGHPLGTDHLGRDILARLLYGGRVSLFIGISAATFSTLLGVTLGLISGYYQGGPLTFVDDFIMWFITTLNSIPTLLLLILLTSVLRPDIGTLIAVLTIVTWTGTMRLIRGEAIVAREQEYIVSARAWGRSVAHHVRPHPAQHRQRAGDFAGHSGRQHYPDRIGAVFLGLGGASTRAKLGQHAHASSGLLSPSAAHVYLSWPDDRDHRLESVPDW